MIRENETILVNKKEFIDLKAKAELYDSYLKEKSSMFNCRSGGIYRDLTNYISALKEAKKGNVSIYFCAGGSLVIVPADKYEEMVKKLEEKDK